MTALTKEYADALFGLSLELEKADAVSEALGTVSDALNENPDYIGFLACYSIPQNERKEALLSAFDGIDGTVLSFLQLLIEQGQIKNFFEIAEEFSKLVLSYKSMSTAKVYSAHPLSDAQKEALVRKLSAICNKTVTIDYIIDSALTGGLRIEVGGQVIDGSIRHRLHAVKNALA